jgi:hypothetical protein
MNMRACNIWDNMRQSSELHGTYAADLANNDLQAARCRVSSTQSRARSV